MATLNPYLEANFFRQFRRYYTYIEPVISDPIVRSYFSVVASLILTSLFVFFALSPTLTTILGLVRKIDDQKQTIGAMDKKIDDLITAQDSYSTFQPRLSALSDALPEIAIPESTINSIYKAASASGVAISGLQFGDISVSTSSAVPVKNSAGVVTNNSVQSVEFSLVVTGTQEKIEAYLANLEHMPRMIKITSLSFGSKKGIVTVSAKSFYLPKNFP